MGIIGIDLGTTFCAVSHLGPAGRPETIRNTEGDTITPSVLLFDSDEDVVVGREARRAAEAAPRHVAIDVKRFMGDETYPRLIGGRKLSPVVLSALVLKKLRQDAERVIGPVEQAVITVPAYFDERRRHATAQAGRLAGLNVIDIINEPTAAALAHLFEGWMRVGDRNAPLQTLLAGQPRRNLVVYDLGGGTFDVTVLSVEERHIRVLATAGDVYLGGRDWDERLADRLAQAFLKKHGADPREDLHARQHLSMLAEEAKRTLSRRQRTTVAINYAGHALRLELTREWFERITEDLLYRTENRVTRVLGEAGLDWAEVDEVLLVGGSTRMPQVVEMLRRVTGREPVASSSPDEVVAHGAAIHAGMCLAQAADPEGADDSALLGRIGRRLFNLLRSVRTTNVNAHSLGVIVHTRHGKRRVHRLIPRQHPLPAQASHCFGTVTAGQQRVTVQVVEGESTRPDACMPLGTCTIEGLPPNLPKGSPIEVTFRYDRSGRIDVKAVHVVSGSWSQTRIERRQGVDQDLIHLNRDLLDRVSIA